MKRLMWIIVAIAAMIMPEIVSGQNQISRQKNKKTEQGTATKPNKQTQPKQRKTAAQTKISEPDGYINGHGYVDLGLPSGTKWATCNVGATSPSDFGNHYSWGETSVKSSYTEENSLLFNKSGDFIENNGIINSNDNLNKAYDVAYSNWGENWRMPTNRECCELVDKCTWIWTIYSGHKGYKVVGPNGKSIFLPAAGSSGDFTIDKGSYWSSSWDRNVYYSTGQEYGCIMSFYPSEYNTGATYICYGLSVRPVTNDVRIKPIGNFGK